MDRQEKKDALRAIEEVEDFLIVHGFHPVFQKMLEQIWLKIEEVEVDHETVS